MNTQTPRRTIEGGNDIVIEGKKPDWIHLLLEDFKPKEMIEENAELQAGQEFTGYPLLLHTVETFMVDKKPEGKNILEIGGGLTFGLGNIRYLRKLTDTVNVIGEKKHHAFGIDIRNGNSIAKKIIHKLQNELNEIDEGKINALSDEVIQSFDAIQSKAIQQIDWNDIATLKDNDENALTFDCIFHHQIGKTPGGYEEVTDNALNPGGYYIAFRRIGGEEPPLNKKILIDQKKYEDQSFSYHYKDGLSVGDAVGYEVTILQKPIKSHQVISGVQDDTDVILAR